MLKYAWGAFLKAGTLCRRLWASQYSEKHTISSASVEAPLVLTWSLLLHFVPSPLHSQKGSDCWYYSERPHGILVSQASSR